MSDNEFDVIFIGGGPGGYAGAIRAAQLGLKTMLIDDRKGEDGKPAPGGTCLNVGCIPSKALLDSSKHFHHIQHDYTDHGISTEGVSIDVDKMLERKRKVVKQLNTGLIQLFKANKIEFVNGRGKLFSERQVEVTPNDGDKYTATAKHVVLAAGSVPFSIPNVEVDNEYILDNVGALEIPEVPERFGVIGAGVIGLEMGSVWSRLGAEVVLFEALDDFLPAIDRDMAKIAQREFKKQKLDIRMGCKVSGAEVSTARSSSATTTARKTTRKCSTVCWWRWAQGRRPTTWWPMTAASNDRPRPDRSRRPLPDQRRKHLGHRRPGTRPDAGAQGFRGRHCRGRIDRRPGRPSSTSRPSRGSSTPIPKSPG